MASDRPFDVVWSAGQIVVHAANEERAIDVALEYLRVREAQRIRVQPHHAQEAESNGK